jgi:hypothetical protein
MLYGLFESMQTNRIRRFEVSFDKMVVAMHRDILEEGMPFVLTVTLVTQNDTIGWDNTEYESTGHSVLEAIMMSPVLIELAKAMQNAI